MLHPSSSAAKLSTFVAGLILTPVALVVLGNGVLMWVRSSTRSWGLLFHGPLLPATGLVLLGILLLIGVVATGLWSSGGLIAAGLLGLVALVSVLFPPVMLAVLRSLSRTGVFSLEILLTSGGAVLLLGAMGAMGLILMWMRRRAATDTSTLTLLGYLSAPLLLVLSALLMLFGLNWPMRIMATLDFRITAAALLSILAILAGLALLIAGILATRWAPGALILPAVVLLIANAVLFFAPHLVPLHSSPLISAARYLSDLAVPTTMGLLFLAFTIVLWFIQRGRSRVIFPTEKPPAYGAPRDA